MLYTNNQIAFLSSSNVLTISLPLEQHCCANLFSRLNQSRHYVMNATKSTQKNCPNHFKNSTKFACSNLQYGILSNVLMLGGSINLIAKTKLRNCALVKKTKAPLTHTYEIFALKCSTKKVANLFYILCFMRTRSKQSI